MAEIVRSELPNFVELLFRSRRTIVEGCAAICTLDSDGNPRYGVYSSAREDEFLLNVAAHLEDLSQLARADSLNQQIVETSQLSEYGLMPVTSRSSAD